MSKTVNKKYSTVMLHMTLFRYIDDIYIETKHKLRNSNVILIYFKMVNLIDTEIGILTLFKTKNVKEGIMIS